MTRDDQLQIADLELEQTGGFIVVYRPHKKARTRQTANGSTKGNKLRNVEIGPGLSRNSAHPCRHTPPPRPMMAVVM